MSSASPLRLIVDANPLIAALLGGAAARVLAVGAHEFSSPQVTLFEVERYIPRVASLIGRTESQVFDAFQRLPVKACQPAIYGREMSRAQQLISGRDAGDVPVVALALALGHPIWTNDRDFDGLPGITTVSTAQLLAGLP